MSGIPRFSRQSVNKGVHGSQHQAVNPNINRSSTGVVRAPLIAVGMAGSGCIGRTAGPGVSIGDTRPLQRNSVKFPSTSRIESSVRWYSDHALHSPIRPEQQSLLLRHPLPSLDYCSTKADHRLVPCLNTMLEYHVSRLTSSQVRADKLHSSARRRSIMTYGSTLPGGDAFRSSASRIAQCRQ